MQYHMPPHGMQQTGVQQPAPPPVYPSTGFGVHTPGSDHGQTPMRPPAGVQMPFPQTEKSGPLLMQPPGTKDMQPFPCTDSLCAKDVY